MASTANDSGYPDTLLLINGEWRQAGDKQSRPVICPSSGEVIGSVASATEKDLNEAVAAAECGFRVWRATPAAERAAIMRAAAGLLRQRASAIARLMTMEQGKPLAEANAEVLAAADIAEWFADEGRRVYGRVVPPRNMNAQYLVTKEPVGLVAAFTPWNFPVNQIIRKLGAALATGCSILIKGPEETPASPAALVQAFIDAGVPTGVVGLVYGEPAHVSSHLIAHSLIRKVTFTGSTQVGKQLAALAGSHMKRVTMELGGHAPVIVAEDADIDLAVRVMTASKFRNAGQVCIAPTRFLVHNSIRAAFARAMGQASESLKVGDGLADGTNMGPLANSRRVCAMESLVADARNRGSTIVTGGERLGSCGNFYLPTVLDDVPLEASVFNDEPFGPLVAIRGFDHLDDAISEANRLPFGLASYAFTNSYATVHKLSTSLEVGMVWINQPPTPFAELPFGGVKDSGYGSEGGPEALEAYLNTKTVAVTVA
ncbi:NAD-dependent succinate-semialdehyde dehydrogenase [Cupriavidus basilensis]